MECDSFPETKPPYPVILVRLGIRHTAIKVPRALGRAHRHRTSLTPRAAST